MELACGGAVPDKPTNLRERVFDFVCNVVLFCRALSTEPGVVRQIETLYWLRVIRRCGLAEEEALRPLIKEAPNVGDARLRLKFWFLSSKFLVLSSEFCKTLRISWRLAAATNGP